MGMIENARLLNQRFPEALVQIYVANDVPSDILEQLKEISTVRLVSVEHKPDARNMFDRFQSIDEPDCSIMFVRDADSRPHARDIACIEDFLESDKGLHIIRDHYWHSTPLLGGLWGIRKSALSEKMATMIGRWLEGKTDFPKQIDQMFLADTIYPLLKTNAMVHDRFAYYETGSALTPFRVEIKDRLFCGQVHRYDSSGNEYTEFEL